MLQSKINEISKKEKDIVKEIKRNKRIEEISIEAYTLSKQDAITTPEIAEKTLQAIICLDEDKTTIQEFIVELFKVISLCGIKKEAMLDCLNISYEDKRDFVLKHNINVTKLVKPEDLEKQRELARITRAEKKQLETVEGVIKKCLTGKIKDGALAKKLSEDYNISEKNVNYFVVLVSNLLKVIDSDEEETKNKISATKLLFDTTKDNSPKITNNTQNNINLGIDERKSGFEAIENFRKKVNG